MIPGFTSQINYASNYTLTQVLVSESLCGQYRLRWLSWVIEWLENGVGILFQWLINDSCYFSEKKKKKDCIHLKCSLYISANMANDLEFMAHFEKKNAPNHLQKY